MKAGSSDSENDRSNLALKTCPNSCLKANCTSLLGTHFPYLIISSGTKIVSYKEIAARWFENDIDFVKQVESAALLKIAIEASELMDLVHPGFVHSESASLSRVMQAPFKSPNSH
jgi:hypothetical protein